MADRMGDSREPCGVLWLSTTSGRGLPLKDSVIQRSVRKDQTQSHRDGAKPRMRKMWTKRPTCRLLKKPWISNRRRAATHPPLMQVCTVWTILKMASDAVW